MSSNSTFEIKKISIFIDSGFFNAREGLDVILGIYNKGIELFCRHKSLLKEYFMCHKTFLEAAFKMGLIRLPY